MTTKSIAAGAIRVGAMLAALSVIGCDGGITGSGYRQEFSMTECALSPTGRSDYFILEPGYQTVLEDSEMRLQITVLDETKVVNGTTVRVVEEREWSKGQLFEVARNFFAICEPTKDVFYFGEDVEFYENGKITGTSGTWRAGKDGAKAGLIMPGKPKVGMKYYQEVAPGVAMDRAEIVSLDETCKTPAGTFSKCMKTREVSSLDFWSSLKFWDVEYKYYAPGIGLVRDQDLVLVKQSFVKKS
jgi:hypothetical protein